MDGVSESLSISSQLSTMISSNNLKIVLLLAFGLSLAGVFGYVAWRCKISPILGYLLAGVVVGPYSPGFVADLQVSEQLAEIGVILMMFGVGLEFRVRDLWAVRRIAIPGAIGQTLLSALLGIWVLHLFGWSLASGCILGLAIGVASTVVLARMLSENHLLNRKDGHIAIGWLIVEDILTVMILILLPSLKTLTSGTSFSAQDILVPLVFALTKFAVLIVILLTIGRKCASFLLVKVQKTRSHELFTLAMLSLIFLIAVGTTLVFGISIALGAFVSGMVIRQTRVHHKALIHSLSMKDAFIAIFFLSVGMLFNPSILLHQFPLFLSVLALIILAKPLIAFVISISFKYSFRTALTVAAALTQIGEFSFILAEEGMKMGFLSNEGYDLIVACALVSIALNPLIFKSFMKPCTPCKT